MSESEHRVLLDDPEAIWEGAVEFRLTYEGPLHAIQRDSRPGQPSRHRENKHSLRVAFHQQLKRLWEVSPALNGDAARSRPGAIILATPAQVGFVPPAVTADQLARKHSLYGFNFVPLVTQELDLLCSLDILLLRPDRPGSVVWAGDIDNRLKTLLDALRLPEAAENYVDRTASDDESPMFCLLEDDKLITRVSVTTDRLLANDSQPPSPHDARLVITVRLKPYEPHRYNAHFN